MSLPKDIKEKHKKLVRFKEDITKLGAFLKEKYPKHMEDKNSDPVEVAIGVMEYTKD